MDIIESELGKLAGYKLIEMRHADFADFNNKRELAIASLYQQIFDKEALGFSEDYHPLSLVLHVLKLQLDYPEENAARLWGVTVPYEPENHLPEKGYIPIEIDGEQQVIVSFMSAIARVNPDIFMNIIGYTASLFKSEEDKDFIYSQVGQVVERTDFVNRKNGIVSEIASVRDHQDGVASLMLMVALRTHLQNAGIDDYWMWTDEKGEGGGQLPMYKKAKKRLGMNVLRILSSDSNRVLFKGVVSEGAEAIDKMTKTIMDRIHEQD